MREVPIAEATGEIEPLFAGAGTDTDEQMSVAILTAQALVSAFARLGREARPPFRWRCASMAGAIRDALLHYFEEAVQ
jgi:hypothetical protein